MFIKGPPEFEGKSMNQISEPGHIAAPPSFTAKQGQYLAFIHAYTLVLGHPPAEADLQRHFRVTPPSVHGMVLSLERSGLIRREPGRARSISVLVDPTELPPLQPSHTQPVKTSVTRY
jgi:DNA-binding MarR family transcriptional regulator